MSRKLAFVLLFLGTQACARSRVEVSKVGPLSDESGIRYYLPKPFLLVTPNPEGDGSYQVEVVILPDPSQEYAIHGRTFFGDFGLNVELEDQLLKKVSWKGADSAVPGSILGTVSEIAKAEIERAAEVADRRAEQRKAFLEKAETELADAEATIREKGLALSLAEIELDFARRLPVADQTRVAKMYSAELEVERAKAELLDAELRRDAIISEREGTLGETAADAQPGSRSNDQVWSPVLFAVQDRSVGKTTSLNLEAVVWGGDRQGSVKGGQIPIPTVSPPPLPIPELREPGFVHSGEVTLGFGSGLVRARTLEFTRAVESATCTKLEMTTDEGERRPYPIGMPGAFISCDAGARTLTVSLLRGDLPPGRYSITVEFRYGQVGPIEKEIKIQIAEHGVSR